MLTLDREGLFRQEVSLLEGECVAAEDLAEQVAGIATLADPIRRDLYLYVIAQATPVSRDQAADARGISRHTVKFHLDKLAEEGLLDVEFKRLSERSGPGAGRPSKLYRRSNRQLSVTVPERRYDLAGQLLASAIDKATDEGRDVPDFLNTVASEWGGRVGEAARTNAGSRPGRERLLDATCEALRDCGYEPLRDGRTVVLANCPFDTLARDHTQLICGMNLAILNAVTEAVPESRLAARLDPAPDRCCVVLSSAGDSGR
jgi:predicted ArsR family transcriptional regulator